MTKLSTLRWAAKGEAGRGGGGSDCVVTPRRRRETESQPPRAAVCTAGRGRTVSSSRDRSAGGAQTHHPGPSCAVVLRPPTTAPRAEGATWRVPKPLGALHGTHEGPSAHRAGRRRNGPREGEGAGRRAARVRAGPLGPRRSGVRARAAKTGRGRWPVVRREFKTKGKPSCCRGGKLATLQDACGKPPLENTIVWSKS